MLDPANVPEVDDQELTARFVLSRSHVRWEKQTLKPDAFIPHPHTKLSVTRHREANEEELWNVGQDVAIARGRKLIGRGEVLAATYRSQRLKVLPDPIAGNPNHVNVADWPANDKAKQKLKAQEIAAVAKFVPVPEPEAG